MVPTVECILATPICPHTLVVRPLVIPANVEVHLESITPNAELMLTVDGQDGEKLSAGDRLIVKKGEALVKLVRFKGYTFFDTLSRKLHWMVAPVANREGELPDTAG